MAAKTPRYQLERVHGSQEIQDLQDRITPVLEKLSADVDSAETRAGSASTSVGTAYKPADPDVWGSDSAPKSVEDALNALVARIAALESP